MKKFEKNFLVDLSECSILTHFNSLSIENQIRISGNSIRLPEFVWRFFRLLMVEYSVLYYTIYSAIISLVREYPAKNISLTLHEDHRISIYTNRTTRNTMGFLMWVSMISTSSACVIDETSSASFSINWSVQKKSEMEVRSKGRITEDLTNINQKT